MDLAMLLGWPKIRVDTCNAKQVLKERLEQNAVLKKKKQYPRIPYNQHTGWFDLSTTAELKNELRTACLEGLEKLMSSDCPHSWSFQGAERVQEQDRRRAEAEELLLLVSRTFEIEYSEEVEAEKSENMLVPSSPPLRPLWQATWPLCLAVLTCKWN